MRPELASPTRLRISSYHRAGVGHVEDDTATAKHCRIRLYRMRHLAIFGTYMRLLSRRRPLGHFVTRAQCSATALVQALHNRPQLEELQRVDLERCRARCRSLIHPPRGSDRSCGLSLLAEKTLAFVLGEPPHKCRRGCRTPECNARGCPLDRVGLLPWVFLCGKREKVLPPRNGDQLLG